MVTATQHVSPSGLVWDGGPWEISSSKGCWLIQWKKFRTRSKKRRQIYQKSGSRVRVDRLLSGHRGGEISRASEAGSELNIRRHCYPAAAVSRLEMYSVFLRDYLPGNSPVMLLMTTWRISEMIIDDPAAYHSTSVCLMLSPTSRS